MTIVNNIDIQSVCFMSVIVLIVCLMSKHATVTENKLHTKSKELLKQSLRWYDDSDKSTITALRNAIYAAAYIKSARCLMDDMNLSRSSGIDVHELNKQINDKEYLAMKKISKELKLKKTSPSSSWIN